jgi:hypothetical protein
MAEFGISDARWIDQMVPEFIWLALLHERRTYAGGAEIARVTAKAAREIVGHGWFAGMSSFVRIPEAARSAFRTALDDYGVLQDLLIGLWPLHADYPQHPLSFLFDDLVRGDRAELKTLLGSLLESRTSTNAMRAQATALYLAFDAGTLKIPPSSGLVDFPEVQHYPKTEDSQRVGSLVRAALNGIALMLPKSEWPAYFWRRGMELERCAIDRRGSE